MTIDLSPAEAKLLRDLLDVVQIRGSLAPIVTSLMGKVDAASPTASVETPEG